MLASCRDEQDGNIGARIVVRDQNGILLDTVATLMSFYDREAKAEMSPDEALSYLKKEVLEPLKSEEALDFNEHVICIAPLYVKSFTNYNPKTSTEEEKLAHQKKRNFDIKSLNEGFNFYKAKNGKMAGIPVVDKVYYVQGANGAPFYNSATLASASKQGKTLAAFIGESGTSLSFDEKLEQYRVVATEGCNVSPDYIKEMNEELAKFYALELESKTQNENDVN
jgi:hypothetical protein